MFDKGRGIMIRVISYINLNNNKNELNNLELAQRVNPALQTHHQLRVRFQQRLPPRRTPQEV